MQEEITSLQNKHIKHLVQLLQKARLRKNTGTFIFEGKRELSLAIRGNYKIKQIYYCPSFVTYKELKTFFDKASTTPQLISISSEIFKKLAYRNTTEGMLIVAEAKNHELETLTLLNNNALVLVAEAPEKPGNIGALLRTTDAVGASAFILANPRTDLYNPNTIRSSVGCIFTNQIATGTTNEIIKFLSKNNIQIVSAALQNAIDYTTVNYQKSTAIVVGTEDKGLSSDWIEEADQVVKIEMHGAIDSMNVSVTAGILLFEARRQRSLQNR
ncbi:RNA methyltransferase [Aquimarina sp. ERC-38]|uniref:TrmH family RNA methyltransferase n=1 Tax=Aquimarina sp. ERC-38 TaxID=2949996 RepID=UPI00224646D2|nr:RNA methyltransferase [Aquimarina sp. ERC-38]UZO80453.1 RNA methyltransferase [Aquimarina sp. ERC-38]